MKMNKQLLGLLSLSMVVVGMSSCGTKDYVLKGTPVTDSTEIRASYVGKHFIEDGIGEVTRLSMCVDGDTTILFVKTADDKEEKITIRYVAIDTPESTGHVEPWGAAASKFNKEKLENAEKIVVDCERSIYDTIDGNGRYLGMVWYQPKGSTKLRNLNLELVELGYSKNYHYEPDSAYFSAFEKAGSYAEKCEAKVYGELDPNFDYSTHVFEFFDGKGVASVYSDYDEITVLSGSIIHIKGLVIGLMGDAFVLRDLYKDENGAYPSIYCFPGYGSSLASLLNVGYVIEFYASAGSFLDNPQLSNINTKLTGDRKMVIENEYDEEKGEYTPYTGPTEEYPELNLAPVEITNYDTITKEQLAAYKYQFVKAQLKIRNVTQGDYDPDGNLVGEGTLNYFKVDAKGNETVYARLNDNTVLNMRINYDLSPKPDHTLFALDKSYIVVGFIQPYYDNFQMMLFNNNARYNYITPVVEA